MAMESYYRQLIGFEIKAHTTEPDEFGGDDFPVFTLEKAGHVPIKLTVSRDPEGNGGGFLFIQNV